MSTLSQLQDLIKAEAAVSVNMNEEVSGGGGRLLPKGYGFGRIVEYVDFGMQPQEYEGQAKEPAPEFRLGIAFTSPGYCNEDGTPYLYRPYSLTLSQNSKSGARKAFKALNWTNDPGITHFAQFLGKGFAFKIDQKISKSTNKPICFVDWAGTLACDPVSQQPYEAAIPQVPDELYTLFLWNNPTLEGWDKLYIEGTTDKGTSKNFLQETILSAKNYVGSPLELLLASNGRPAAPVVRSKPGAQATPSAPVAAAPAAAVVAPAAPVVAAPAVAAPVVTPPLAQPAAAAPVGAAFAVVAPSVTAPTTGTPSVTPASAPTTSPSDPAAIAPPAVAVPPVVAAPPAVAQ